MRVILIVRAGAASADGTLPHPPQTAQAVSTDALIDQITELAGHLNAGTHRWLVLIAEFDRRPGWNCGLTKSCAHWLNWKCGVDLGAAHESAEIRIDRTTAATRWLGETMDYCQTIDVLVQRAEAAGTFPLKRIRNQSCVAHPPLPSFSPGRSRHEFSILPV
jgi:hypothetical protein